MLEGMCFPRVCSCHFDFRKFLVSEAWKAAESAKLQTQVMLLKSLCCQKGCLLYPSGTEQQDNQAFLSAPCSYLGDAVEPLLHLF